MTPAERRFAGALTAVFVGLILIPAVGDLSGTRAYGIANVIGAAFSYFLFTRWPRFMHSVDSEAERLARDPFDQVTARRESHAAGIPFPESDGTLSFPPPPDPGPSRPADTFVPVREIGQHVEHCRCIRAPGPTGKVARDPRCKVLRKRS